MRSRALPWIQLWCFVSERGYLLTFDVQSARIFFRFEKIPWKPVRWFGHTRGTHLKARHGIDSKNIGGNKMLGATCCIRSADFCTLSTASNWAKVLTSVRCINFAVLLMSNVHHQRGDVIKGSRMLKNKAQSDQAGDNVSVWWDFLGLLGVPNLRQFDLFDGHSRILWWKNKPILADDVRLQYNDSWQQCVHTWSQPVRNVSFPRGGPAFGVFSAMFQNAGLNAGVQAWRQRPRTVFQHCQLWRVLLCGISYSPEKECFRS